MCTQGAVRGVRRRRGFLLPTWQHSTAHRWVNRPAAACRWLDICHNSLLKQLEELGLVALQLGNHLLHRTHAALVL